MIFKLDVVVLIDDVLPPIRILAVGLIVVVGSVDEIGGCFFELAGGGF